MSTRSGLRRLASACGVIEEYIDAFGQKRVASDDVLEATLSAMGVDASSEAKAERALAELAERRALIEPVRVAAPGRPASRANVRLPTAGTTQVEWEAELTTEGGDRRECGGTAATRGAAATLIVSPATDLDVGYHRLRIRVRSSGSRSWQEGEQALLVTPELPLATAAFGFGIHANLYTVRSRRNLGFGNLGDLRYLLEWAGRLGATFVAISPVHALSNRGDGICPYFPLSRLFGNPLYLDVLEIPEWKTCRKAQAIVSSPGFSAEAERLRAGSHIEHEQVERLLGPVFSLLHREFQGACAREQERAHAYEDFRRRNGRELEDFAAFVALGEYLDGAGRGERGDWRTWPAEYQRPDSEAVRRFAETRRERIELECFLQFELERQLAALPAVADRCGLDVGVIGDLAVGSAAGGADTWAFGDLFARDTSIGAPPDAFCPQGQDWRLAPMLPRRLREGGWRLWRAMVRRALVGMGGLRIDHAIGLERLYWVAGDPERGAYVRMPAELLLAVLAIEARRAGAVLIAEDLGTVPEGLRGRLADWGLLRTQVLYFERDEAGAFRSSDDYAADALVTANTHDLPTLAGFWSGRDMDEQLADDRDRRRAALRERLAEEGVVPRAWQPQNHGELCAAVHTFLGRTPGRLVGVSLDDLGGETTAVNVPGTTAETGANWKRRMKRSLEELAGDASVPAALGELPRRRARPGRT
ncbi:MAG: 4-alpha-glucanotransferase [Deltaproteobacteria bacterium]|nr:MAG: 4-alpha-glucanotransferase [Deltaproteobacteria bacterium]